MRYALLKTMEPGTPLIPVFKHIDQNKIDKFGVLSGSTGSVHVDPAFCANLPFKTTLAHGFLTMAYASEMMEVNFGMDWAVTGSIEVKFVGQAHPGDTVLTQGTITGTERTAEGLRVECELSINNQNDKKVLAGTASLVCKNAADGFHANG